MKNQVFQKASSLFVGASIRLGVLLALLLLAAPSSPAAENPSAEARRSPELIVGTWAFKAHFFVPVPGFAGSEFQGVETYHSDGTMSVLTNLPGVTIGLGVWKKTGLLSYSFSFSFYRPDPSSPFLLETVVNENMIITDNGDGYTTTDLLRPLDASGAPIIDAACNPLGFGGICQFPGIVKAKRYPLANYNQVLP